MRNAFLILLTVFASCKKQDPDSKTTIPAPITTHGTIIQDNRLIGGWRLDSIRVDSVVTVNNLSFSTAPFTDSIVFSNDHLKSFAWLIGTGYIDATSGFFDTWDTPHTDSLFIHSNQSYNVYLSYKYLINNSSLTIALPHPVNGHYRNELHYNK